MAVFAEVAGVGGRLLRGFEFAALTADKAVAGEPCAHRVEAGRPADHAGFADAASAVESSGAFEFAAFRADSSFRLHVTHPL